MRSGLGHAHRPTPRRRNPQGGTPHAGTRRRNGRPEGQRHALTPLGMSAPPCRHACVEGTFLPRRQPRQQGTGACTRGTISGLSGFATRRRCWHSGAMTTSGPRSWPGRLGFPSARCTATTAANMASPRPCGTSRNGRCPTWGPSPTNWRMGTDASRASARSSSPSGVNWLRGRCSNPTCLDSPSCTRIPRMAPVRSLIGRVPLASRCSRSSPRANERAPSHPAGLASTSASSGVCSANSCAGRGKAKRCRTKRSRPRRRRSGGPSFP